MTTFAKCGRCALALPPGATHAGELGCIDALRAALDALSACSQCGVSLTIPFCSRCAASSVVSGLVRRAGGAIKDAAVDYVRQREKDGGSGIEGETSRGRKFTP